MDWETAKENAVPVKCGRSKAALSALGQELADETGVLEAKRRYIKWMQEYGVGAGKADLQKVLEACTKELQRHARYNNDIRFLRLWIQYADCLPDPADVFLFLKEKGIGQDFALYYEAYATYFELKGNFQSADAVYLDGVQRGAKPLERLKQKHHAFQQRMPEQKPRGLRAPVGVLEDEEFTGGENAMPGLPGYISMPQINNLRDLKPYQVIRKENMDRPAAWNQAAPLLPGFGGPAPAATGGGAAGSSGLEIFTDEEFQEADGGSGQPDKDLGPSAQPQLGCKHPVVPR
ncbi:CKS2 protein [Gonium pectorale]|uniref:CKS2 protein n=1 Tax=Gonium pectorale TaxID=33097 RepID=A0A150GUT0_GONPE|nr:CKS2 protein [Gonium pectorale]|eukprot:KXZ53625.1 CKS2 protein [Gonium pectorale]